MSLACRKILGDMLSGLDAFMELLQLGELRHDLFSAKDQARDIKDLIDQKVRVGRPFSCKVCPKGCQQARGGGGVPDNMEAMAKCLNCTFRLAAKLQSSRVHTRKTSLLMPV